jgi:hypothetical protein
LISVFIFFLSSPPADELEKDDDYHMPAAYDDAGAGASKRYEVLTQRYR